MLNTKEFRNGRACFAIAPMRAPRRKKKVLQNQRAYEFGISCSQIPSDSVILSTEHHAIGCFLLYLDLQEYYGSKTAIFSTRVYIGYVDFSADVLTKTKFYGIITMHYDALLFFLWGLWMPARKSESNRCVIF